MQQSQILCAPIMGTISTVLVKLGEKVVADQALVIIESMKMQHTICAESQGTVSTICQSDHECHVGEALVTIKLDLSAKSTTLNALLVDLDSPSKQVLLNAQIKARRTQTLDAGRPLAVEKRHSKGHRTARENLSALCDEKYFIEYGQFAVAAQRFARPYEELKSSTAADGVITGVGKINVGLVGQTNTPCTLVINDYTVLAGTQGYFHHMKLDRILAVSLEKRLPIIMFTEGGGGRPGDTDISTVNSGLQCQTFSKWAKLSGVVPRIAVANGYCFAGNAALFGAADITIATKQSWIGMAGPAMIEGGGLGIVDAEEIGPSSIQAANGVIDILVDDEAGASQMAKKCLLYFQGPLCAPHIRSPLFPQDALQRALPEDRRFVYDIRHIIDTLADADSFTEIKPQFGAAVLTGFMHLAGYPLGVIASNCKVLGGAIDIDAAEKVSQFMNLCQQFSIPLLVLCDTPGFMVGPAHESRGAVRRLSQLFLSAAKLTVPLVAVVLRKCYGLGAQALLGGSTSKPTYTFAWPSGEFGAMGLEGAVKLGYRKRLEAEKDPVVRQNLFERLLAEHYVKGQAQEVASVLEIDAVIDPVDTRNTLILAYNFPL
jgi:acetyl-CoA carboxylase carboxyltransferase component